jgi:hypothetical protein
MRYLSINLAHKTERAEIIEQLMKILQVITVAFENYSLSHISDKLMSALLR